jgi:hypothetical protein
MPAAPADHPASAPRYEARYELHFRSLAKSFQGCSFPSDAHGRVDLDALSEHSRIRYFVARVITRRELAVPEVRCLPAAVAAPTRPDAEHAWSIAA